MKSITRSDTSKRRAALIINKVPVLFRHPGAGDKSDEISRASSRFVSASERKREENNLSMKIVFTVGRFLFIAIVTRKNRLACVGGAKLFLELVSVVSISV